MRHIDWPSCGFMYDLLIMNNPNQTQCRQNLPIWASHIIICIYVTILSQKTNNYRFFFHSFLEQIKNLQKKKCFSLLHQFASVAKLINTIQILSLHLANNGQSIFTESWSTLNIAVAETLLPIYSDKVFFFCWKRHFI